MKPTTVIAGSNNTINDTSITPENLTSTLGNATRALENATAGLISATRALQNASTAPPPPPATNNGTTVNATKVINYIFDTYLPHIFIAVIAGIIVIPLVWDMRLAYRRKPTGSSSDNQNGPVRGMPELHRSLMTFGIIVLVATVIFYLLALITLNINNSTSPVLQSLIELLKNLGTILGTALATIIAFYFGVRGTESATEKAAAVAAAATKTAGDKVPPQVLNTIPADGATGVAVTSPISATFSEPMSGPTINENTFTVRKGGEANPIKGDLSLGPDGKTAIFDPKPDLDTNSKYISEINEGAKDLAGNALVSPKRWSFKTATA
jgi:hypothetical protein